jgi:2-polyprenyl-6-hydroxyphenyl methylase/3-demethylubiquinone-9 3-methyltransferase
MLSAGATVADLGCGNGALLGEFRARGLRLYGVDASSSGIGQAKRAYPEIHFSQGDLTGDMSGHEAIGACDLVISTEVVEHIFLPRLFVANCYRMLKPGGVLLMTTPYHGYLKNLALAATGKLDGHFTALWDYGHIKFWSRQTLTRLLEEAGFHVDRFQGVGRMPYLWKTMVLTASRPPQ